MSEELPDLEDCSGLYGFKPKIKTSPAVVHSPAVLPINHSTNNTNLEGPKITSQSAIKKGFFLSAKSSPVCSSQEPKQEVIILESKIDPKDSLRFPEVQKAMQSTLNSLKNDSSWVTPTLMQAIIQDPLLARSMTEPHLQEALQVLQKDPKEAKKRYQNDPEVTEMLSRYMKVLGVHFEKLGSDRVTERTSTEASGFQPIHDLPVISRAPDSDPLVRSILADPQVSLIVDYVRKGGQLDPRRLHPAMFEKIKILIDKGVFQLHT